MRLLILIALFPYLAIPAPTRSQDDPFCRTCEGTGKIAAKSKAKNSADSSGDLEALYRSWVVEKDSSCGLGWAPCPKCKSRESRKEIVAEFDQHVSDSKAWLAETRKLDDSLGASFSHIETPHFKLAWGVPKIRTDSKKVYTQEQSAELYAQRFEAFYQRFKDVFAIKDEDFRNSKHHIIVVQSAGEVIRGSELLLNMRSDTSAYQGGNPSIFVAFYDRGTYRSDGGFHRHCIHMLTHLFSATFHFMRQIDDFGLLHEGLAHWFEIDQTGSASNSCNREQIEEGLGGIDFELEVSKIVLSGKAPEFATLATKRTPDLEGSEHALAWSWTEFLIATNAEKTRDLIGRLKHKAPLRESLRDLFGWNFNTMQEAWLEHVKSTYKKPR